VASVKEAPEYDHLVLTCMCHLIYDINITVFEAATWVRKKCRPIW